MDVVNSKLWNRALTFNLLISYVFKCHCLSIQVRRVLVDLNGQWASETPKPSKQTATPRVCQTPKVGITATCLEPIVPRALFSENGSNPALNSVKRPIMMRKISTESLAWDPRVTKPSTLLLQSPAIRVRIREEDSTQTSCVPTTAHETPKMQNAKKRARDEDENEDKDDDEESRKRSDDTSRVTRSKAEADRIALFLRSPAVRVPVLSPKRKQKACAASSDSLAIKLPAEKKPRYSKTGTSDSHPAEEKPRYAKTGTSDSLPEETKPRYANTGTPGSLVKLPVDKKPRYVTAMEGEATKEGDAATGQQSLELPATIPHEVFPVILEEDLEPLEVVKRVWAVTSSSPAIRVRVHSPGHRESLLRSPLVVKKPSFSFRKSSSSSNSNTGRSSLRQKASTKKNNLATKKKLAGIMDSEM